MKFIKPKLLEERALRSYDKLYDYVSSHVDMTYWFFFFVIDACCTLLLLKPIPTTVRQEGNSQNNNLISENIDSISEKWRITRSSSSSSSIVVEVTHQYMGVTTAHESSAARGTGAHHLQHFILKVKWRAGALRRSRPGRVSRVCVCLLATSLVSALSVGRCWTTLLSFRRKKVCKLFIFFAPFLLSYLSRAEDALWTEREDGDDPEQDAESHHRTGHRSAVPAEFHQAENSLWWVPINKPEWKIVVNAKISGSVNAAAAATPNCTSVW